MPCLRSSCSAPLALLLTLACAGKDEPADTAGPFARRCESVSFNLTPTPYTLPMLAGEWAEAGGFYTLSDWNKWTVDGETQAVYWSFVDLLGDDRRDLVITDHSAEPGTGTQRWQVYEGLETGFSTTPVDYAVPTLDGDWESSRGFYLASGESTRRSEEGLSRRYIWSLLDVTNDGRPDLVLTEDQLDLDVGRTAWRVYEGGEDGFAPEPYDYALPALVGDWASSDGFYALEGDGNRLTPDGEAYFSYAWHLEDLNADGVQDLLLTFDSAEYRVSGHTQWTYYPGDAQGFSEEPLVLALPPLACDDWLQEWLVGAWASEGQLSRTVDGVSATYFWYLSDVTRDGVLDILLSWDEADPLVGPSEWRVYEGGPSGYDVTPMAYPVPRLDGEWDTSPGFAAQSGSVYRMADGEYAFYNWDTPNLAEDNANDLMLTYDQLDPQVGQAVWRVYIADEAGVSAEPSYEIALPTLEGTFEEFPAFFGTNATTERMVGEESLMYSWRLYDITHDGVKDLILTSDEVDPSIGSAAWHVYEGICHE